MAEIKVSRDEDAENYLQRLLLILLNGGEDQKRLAAQGAATVGYLGLQEDLSPAIQELVDASEAAISNMMIDGDPQIRQTGMNLAWNQYVGRREGHLI